MIERPILFSAPMVRAVLDGSKTQTRREFKARNGGLWPNINDLPGMRQLLRECKYGQPGDRLWVRESIFLSPETDRHHYCATGLIGPGVDYEAEPSPSMGLPAKSIPSIHMPRWASRITLEVVSVRVERLQAINEVDAIAEGAQWAACGSPQEGSHRAGYAQLWESINGPGSWVANPWVWVVEFKKVTA